MSPSSADASAGTAVQAGSPESPIYTPARSRYALSFKGRMILNPLLLELQDELDKADLEGLAVRWG